MGWGVGVGVGGGGSCHLPTPDKVHSFCLFLLSSEQPIGGGGVATS